MAAVLICQGERVLWVDYEMGRMAIAERLQALGLRPEDVSANLFYLEMPTFGASVDDRDLWAALVQQVQPKLVVWDAQTEALALADVEENSGTGWKR
jgi:hypothetical protein